VLPGISEQHSGDTLLFFRHYSVTLPIVSGPHRATVSFLILI